MDINEKLESLTVSEMTKAAESGVENGLRLHHLRGQFDIWSEDCRQLEKLVESHNIDPGKIDWNIARRSFEDRARELLS